MEKRISMLPHKPHFSICWFLSDAGLIPSPLYNSTLLKRQLHPSRMLPSTADVPNPQRRVLEKPLPDVQAYKRLAREGCTSADIPAAGDTQN